jgi:hypothetical protein
MTNFVRFPLSDITSATEVTLYCVPPEHGEEKATYEYGELFCGIENHAAELAEKKNRDMEQECCNPNNTDDNYLKCCPLPFSNCQFWQYTGLVLINCLTQWSRFPLQKVTATLK